MWPFKSRSLKIQDSSSADTMYRGDVGGRWCFNSSGPIHSPKVAWMYPVKNTRLLPTASENNVIVASEKDCISALNQKTGQVKWKKEVDIDSILEYATPAISRGRLFIVDEGHKKLHAINFETGKSLWHSKKVEAIMGPPLIVGNIIYLGTFDHINAINVSSGSFKWRYKYESPIGGGTHGPLAYSSGILCFRSAVDHIVALEAHNGKLLWEHDTDGYIGGMSFPTIVNQHVFYGNERVLHMINLKTGKYEGEKFLEGSVGCFDDTSVYATEMNITFAYDISEIDNIRRRWVYPPFDKQNHFGHFLSGAVANKVLYFGSEKGMTALDCLSGKLLWQLAVGRVMQGTRPMIAEGRLFVIVDVDKKEQLCVIE